MGVEVNTDHHIQSPAELCHPRFGNFRDVIRPYAGLYAVVDVSALGTNEQRKATHLIVDQLFMSIISHQH